MKWPYMYRMLSVGADPEVFLKDVNGNPVSAEGKIGGTKDNPLPMPGLPEGFGIQEDNVAAEYNIPPAANRAEFSKNILAGLAYVEKVVKKQGYRVSCESALHFDDLQLSTPHAQHLGCSPDFNVWTRANNRRPIPPRSLRTAAGHVHLSWKIPNEDSAVILGRLLDVYLGIPSLLATVPNERRKLYGQAGAVRIKSYGLEYRVLDNFWLTSKAQQLFIFDTVALCMEKLNHQQELLEEELEIYSQPIQDTINYHDLDTALQLMQHFGTQPFPEAHAN